MRFGIPKPINGKNKPLSDDEIKALRIGYVPDKSLDFRLGDVAPGGNKIIADGQVYVRTHTCMGEHDRSRWHANGKRHNPLGKSRSEDAFPGRPEPDRRFLANQDEIEAKNALFE